MTYVISIHALLAESDRLWTILYSCPGNFYPRSPCGERQCTPWNSPTRCYFYPRSPCGERQGHAEPMGRAPRISIHALLAESDETSPYRVPETQISIHALLAESDYRAKTIATKISHFYPRSPCGERPDLLTDDVSTGGFLSTLSLRRATLG